MPCHRWWITNKTGSSCLQQFLQLASTLLLAPPPRVLVAQLLATPLPQVLSPLIAHAGEQEPCHTYWLGTWLGKGLGRTHANASTSHHRPPTHWCPRRFFVGCDGSLCHLTVRVTLVSSCTLKTPSYWCNFSIVGCPPDDMAPPPRISNNASARRTHKSHSKHPPPRVECLSR